jgi:hypothetical protein
MNPATEPLTFTVSLALSAHTKAKQFSRHHPSPQKAEHVYFNTLAVYAVNFYLQCLGFEADLSASDSWNPVMQTLMDVADLEIKDCGKLECRPVLFDDQVCYFPEEVWLERVGYVAVQLNKSLTEATLLGFSEKAETKEIPLSQLQSLEDLPKYLRSVKQVPIHLREWFEGVFANGWQTVSALFSTEAVNPVLNARSGSLAETAANQEVVGVQGGKLIDLGMQLAGYPVTLIVTIVPASVNEKMLLCVKIFPAGDQICLPPSLQLIVLDEAGAICLQGRARNADNWMQLQFTGKPKERFSVKVAFGDASITENFVI